MKDTGKDRHRCTEGEGERVTGAGRLQPGAGRKLRAQPAEEWDRLGMGLRRDNFLEGIGVS